MNSENKNKSYAVTAATGRRKINFPISGPVWLLAGALWLAGVVSSPAAALIWHGVNYVNNNWDTNAPDQNWQSGATPNFPFNNGDSVTFNNNGFPSTNVNVGGLVQPASMTVDTSVVNYAFTNATGSIIGPGGLFVTGNNTNTLTLATTNSFSGGTTLTNGAILQLNNTTAAGPGPITNYSSTVVLSSAAGSGTFYLPNSLNCIGTNKLNNSGHTGGLKVLTGSGSLAVNSPGQVFDLAGDMTGYGGTLVLSNCTSGVRFNGTTGSSAATFDLGNGTLGLSIRNGATAIALGGLTGAGNGTTLSANSSSAWGATFNIGGNNANTTFAGKIANGSNGSASTTAINKVGTGTLTLSGTNNSYSGTTTVSGGVLAITGLAWPTNSTIIDVATNSVLDVSGLAGSLLTLSSNQTLTGSGTIRGSVNAPTNSTILPGDGVGVLTVSNGTFSSTGALIMELNRTNSTATNDMLKADSITITGGTLTVTNLGPDLHAGDSFKLFSVAIGGSGFATVSLPASNVLNSVQYVWTNRLALDGSVQVLNAISSSPSPTNISYTVAGSQLILNWPSGQGWRLLAQTNSLLTGLTTNWSATGVTTSPFTNTVNPANGTVFYRLTYP